MACKTKSLLLALSVAALLAARSESHGLGDFTSGSDEATTTPEMQTFFKPQAAAALPEALDASMPAKPEATALPATTTAAAATTAGTAPSATPRRSVSVAAGVACGVAAVAVAGIAAAVAYVVVRGARRGTEVQLG
ncbi:hypothetical protein Zm00014a_024587 [Zea mays]|jgi:hypothetical protein|nr:uncharacterized protein LOC100275301 precursor [Zea mays]XP_020400550.1 uncharacterized protein LOC100275301 isoform X1 [Zea mays]ACG27318.1 hypothetical protein [Zea mays]ACG40711.1 hypothetical protein [Zea mays]PWZ43638.1 hypothetical protein Zm00014a_024587 [Zea mays]|eukprot:NP_001314935.1 uncharacterized protein LOC100275301 precursor [Zea mays]